MQAALPPEILENRQFQNWLRTQEQVGNRLEKAEMLWQFLTTKQKTVFACVIKVEIFIAAEQRMKTNEFIICRPDISAVVAYHKKKELLDTEILIVREFRANASLGDCFIREVPSGSSSQPDEDSLTVARHELLEEAGLSISPERLITCGSRQVAATFSTYQARVFACALSAEEMAKLKKEKDINHGVAEDGERTYTEIYTVRELLARPLTDWANLGMILQTILAAA